MTAFRISTSEKDFPSATHTLGSFSKELSRSSENEQSQENRLSAKYHYLCGEVFGNHTRLENEDKRLDIKITYLEEHNALLRSKVAYLDAIVKKYYCNDPDKANKYQTIQKTRLAYQKHFQENTHSQEVVIRSKVLDHLAFAIGMQAASVLTYEDVVMKTYLHELQQKNQQLEHNNSLKLKNCQALEQEKNALKQDFQNTEEFIVTECPSSEQEVYDLLKKV